MKKLFNQTLAGLICDVGLHKYTWLDFTDLEKNIQFSNNFLIKAKNQYKNAGNPNRHT